MSTNAEVIHHVRQHDWLTRYERTACGLEVERDTNSSPDQAEVTCPACLAAPSSAGLSGSAEAMLKTVGAKLGDLRARIEGVFEDEHADSHAALEQVQYRIEELLGLLGVPLPAAATVASMTCPVCQARLTFDRWGLNGEAWREEQVRLHIADCATNALSWVLYRPENGLPGDVLVSAGASGPAPGDADPIELARVQLVEHAAGRDAWVVKVFGPDDRLRAYAEWEQGQAVGYAAGKAA
jgi:hypothetical protein